MKRPRIASGSGCRTCESKVMVAGATGGAHPGGAPAARGGSDEVAAGIGSAAAACGSEGAADSCCSLAKVPAAAHRSPLLPWILQNNTQQSQEDLSLPGD